MANSNSFGFGSRLRKARESMGLTGTELGKGAGESGKDASKASVSDWENERHYPKADQLRVICLKLNISPDDLVFGDIKEELRFIQAQSALQALSADQRKALLDRMASHELVNKGVNLGITTETGSELRPDTVITKKRGHTEFIYPTSEVTGDGKRNPDTAESPKKRRKRS